MHLVGIMAVCAACAVQGRASARQRRMLTRLSQTDALTGIVNRRGFQERFAAELALARRERRPIGLLVVDLDGFKRLNDSAGHAAGDDLLRWVAATLGAGARPDGVVGRLGGDEFVMLLRPPATDPRTTAERLRAALAERTPASVGTAVLDAQDGSFAALYALADAELYREKAKRRPVAHERPAPALGLGR
jgi:diguanylate cyclase (GGDEF)-like protein